MPPYYNRTGPGDYFQNTMTPRGLSKKLCSHESEALFTKPLDLHLETLSQHLKNPEHSMGKEGLNFDQTIVSYMP